MRDTVVIGAGLAGLSCALKLAESGQKVTLVTKGIGGIQLGQGTVDVFGYNPQYIDQPLKAVDEAQDGHPYSLISSEKMSDALRWFQGICPDGLLVGDGQKNYRLPTAVGALRPTALAQTSMVAGQPTPNKKFVIVGLKRLKDFYPQMVAQNLGRQKDDEGNAITSRAVEIDFEARPGEEDTSGLNFARALDDPSRRQEFCALIKPLLQDGETVGLPAVLGIKDLDAWKDIEKTLGHPVFEIPLLPPSVPGMRINEHLMRLAKAKVRVVVGAAVTGYDCQGENIKSITISSAGSPKVIEAKDFVLATGGFESGALLLDSYGDLSETVFGLPVHADEEALLHDDYWGKEQPLFQAGVKTDDELRPINKEGEIIFQNLRIIGGLLPGATRWREKSGDGIALVSALHSADMIVKK